MSFQHLPEDARKSALIKTLAQKVAASQRPGTTTFDFAGKLVELERRVTAEISYINNLFPEYTPHDAHYHITRLFSIADRVIEKPRLKKLNTVELFILACSLYGHDWGMAVSEPERQAIADLIQTGKKSDSIPLLPDEKKQFEKFAESCGTEPLAAIKEIGLWREYVRRTHAWRSAERISKFFARDGEGVGEACARACRGHWLDFSELDRPDRYPSDFATLGVGVDLLAITLYVRLIDLLDVASDRTPYAIWNFVAPRNPRSVMEWSKHRSLNPVICAKFESARRIVVDGVVKDPEVDAELADLRDYIDSQLKGCNDLLDRHCEAKYHLNLHHVHWRVEARGFKRLDLRFEFHREKMFQLLSNEIYQGDGYVFLRELLQNSIDAIHLRRALVTEEGEKPIDGLIRFSAQQLENGDYVVTCQDNGVGMDEYIIKNYLAVAGKSYYSSNDFQQLGVKMDVISRFGIGILSCFMVADHISIETMRAAISGKGPSECLFLDIPSVGRQFRVSAGKTRTTPGTTVTVHVKQDKIRTSPAEWGEKLQVAEYLSIIAGFVDIPIYVDAFGKSTLILHPDTDVTKERNRLSKLSGKQPSEITIKRVEKEYPDVLAPQDSALFTQVADISIDEPNDPHYQGFIARIMPKDINVYISLGESSDMRYKQAVSICPLDEDSSLKGKEAVTLRWDKYPGPLIREQPRSAICNWFTKVFSNGILVAGVSENSLNANEASHLMPSPYYCINITSNRVERTDVARQQLGPDSRGWKREVNALLLENWRKTWFKDLSSLSPEQLLVRLGQIIVIFHLDNHDVEALLPDFTCPVPLLISGGILRIVPLSSLHDSFYCLPDDFENIGRTFTNKTLLKLAASSEIAELWHGEESYHDSLSISDDDIFTKIHNYTETVIDKQFSSEDFRVIYSISGEYPILQPVYRRKIAQRHDIQKAFSLALDTPNELQDEEWNFLFDNIFQTVGNYKVRLSDVPTIFGLRCYYKKILAPWDKIFALNINTFNTNHPTMRQLMRGLVATTKSPHLPELSPDRQGQLRDKLGKLQNIFLEHLVLDLAVISNYCNQFLNAVHEANLIRDRPDPVSLTFEDFVPGSVRKEGPSLISGVDPDLHYKVGPNSARFGMPYLPPAV